MKQLEIFRFWLPLFASWLLMTAEGPLISTAVNRLPDEVVMLAAFGIVLSLAVLIESPIINLLATATALVQDQASFRQVRRFTWHWMLLLTAISALLAFTPLFDVVVPRLMGVPAEVARWVRPGLGILVLWSAAIAWRRFLQGVMIRCGRTRLIGWGTAVRLSSVVVATAAMAWWGKLPGIYVAASALMVGVTTEALYATVMVRRVVREDLPERNEGPVLSYRELFDYHLPLAGTSVLTLLVQPMISFSLARLDQPTLSLAAWPLIFHFMLLMRAAAFALPEVVIALGHEPENHRPLKRFSFTLAALSFGAMLALTLTPLARLYLFDIQNTTAEIAALAHRGFFHFLPLPALVTLISWQRGVLMRRRRTGLINKGVVVRLAVFVAALAVSLSLRLPGIPAAAWSVNVSVLGELIFLGWRMRARSAKEPPPDAVDGLRWGPTQHRKTEDLPDGGPPERRG